MVHSDRPVRNAAHWGNTRLNLPTLALIFAGTGSNAAAGGNTFDFDLPAQSLSTALDGVAKTSGVKLMYADAAVQGLKTPAVRGRMTSDEALKRVLAQNGLRHEWVDKTLVAVKENSKSSKEASLALDSVSVTDSAEEDRRSYAVTRTSSATKTDTPIMETPVSIQAVPRAVMEDQQVVKVEDAIKNVSGVQKNFSFGDLRENFTIRGFTTDTQTYRNGVRLPRTTFETAHLQQIEVLKGPSSVLYGRIQPGGMVNLVTKQPQDQPYYALQQQFGSYDFYRTTVDATGPLTDDLSYRVNLAYLNADSFRDLVGQERLFFTPSVSWKLGERTRLNLALEYTHDNSVIDAGIVANGDRPAKVPRSQFMGDRGDFTRQEGVLLDFNWSHAFNDDWALKHAFLYDDRDFRESYRPVVDFGNDEYHRGLWQVDNPRKTYATSLDLTGKFETFGVKHSLLLGGDYYRHQELGEGCVGPGQTGNCLPWPPSIDGFDPFNPRGNSAFNLDTHRFPSRESFNYDTASLEEWYGLYFQDQITLFDQLHILGGGRYDWIHQKNTNRWNHLFFTQNQFDALETQFFSPRVGILYRPWQWLSVYGNFVESIGSNLGRSFTGEVLTPETATQYEIGTKTEFWDGRLIASLAYYHLAKDNIQAVDVANSADNTFFRTASQARSEGIELDVSGKITEDLSVIGTYAFTDARIKRDDQSPDNQGNRLSNVPEHSGSLWFKYDLPFESVRGLTFGTGAFVAGQREGDNENTFQLPGYVRWDAMAAYRFDVGPTRLTAQINVNNILDKTYFKAANTLDGAPQAGITVGEPLTVLGSLRLEY
ncbi:TonB-dependent receptor [Methylocaldum sp.]|uniref:TonB-dependent siderophore receptor n=1 Tax=Methylocaldum sp. TaxID=1969727 RepID=UPI002D4AF3A2|nr:TonB-dependent receptor [Methylocaldum sp.]HYE37045.1 TonB-dependent receptor [Methylocaldum sp.]